jgi:hypothetical protein
MSIPLMADIVEAVPAVKCVKLESTPTAARTRQLINTMTGRPGILNRPTILTGLGGLYGVPPPFPIRMPSAFPEVLIAMVAASKLQGGSASEECAKIFKEYTKAIRVAQLLLRSPPSSSLEPKRRPLHSRFRLLRQPIDVDG